MHFPGLFLLPLTFFIALSSAQNEDGDVLDKPYEDIDLRFLIKADHIIWNIHF